MVELRIHLFGAFEVLLNDVPVHFRTNKARALLVYLVVNANKPHTRDALIDLLWQDVDRALGLGNLRKTLSHLRKNLADKDHNFFTVTRSTIQFNTNDGAAYIDTRLFDINMQRVQRHKHPKLIRCADCAELLREATTLHHSEFLDGFVVDSGNFSDWQMLNREQRYNENLEALQQLGYHALEIGFWSDALHYARRQIRFEPWREQPARLAVAALVEVDDKAAALFEYRQFSERLATVIGSEPSAEFQQYIEGIKAQRLLPSKVLAPNNLSVPHRAFFGRNKEIRTVSERLIDPNYRWITLIGEGGIGKTFLAETIGRRLLSQFSDGVWMIRFSVVRTSAPNSVQAGNDSWIASMILATLGLETNAGGDNLDIICDYFANKRILLIFDNFEHITEGRTFIHTLLKRLPNITLLVTSRSVVGGKQEHLAALEGLPTEISVLEQLPESVMLFCEYAKRTSGRSDLVSPTDLYLIGRICEYLAGNPLAIQLAAARVYEHGLAQMMQAIRANLNALTSPLYDVEPRHRSIRAAYDYSWVLLEENEKRIFSQLSINLGSFNLNLVQAITDATPKCLAKLVEKSLLQQSAESYHIHPLLRQYSAEKLAAFDDGALLQKTQMAYCQHYLTQAAALKHQIFGPHPTKAVATVRRRMPDIFKAWGIALQSRQIELLEAASVSLGRTARTIGALEEIAMLFESGIEQARLWLRDASDDQTDIKMFLCWMLLNAARGSLLRWELDSAEKNLREAITIARDTNNIRPLAWGLFLLAEYHFVQSSYAEAKVFIYESLSIAKQNSIATIEARCLMLVAKLHESHDEALDKAADAYTKATEIAMELGDIMLLADIYELHGLNRLQTGDLENGKALLGQAHKLAYEQGHRLLQIELLHVLATASINEGSYHEAERQTVQLIEQAAQIGHKHHLLEANRLFAQIATKTGDFEKAKAFYSHAMDIAREEDWSRDIRRIQRRYSNFYYTSGDYNGALECARLAYAGAKEDGGAGEFRSCCVLLGNALLAKGQYAEALIYFERAIGRSGNESNRKLEPCIGAMMAAYCLEQADVAAKHAADALAYLQSGKPVYAVWQPALVFLRLGMYLHGTGRDEHANEILQLGVDMIKQRAKKLKDADIRASYVNIDANRQLLANMDKNVTIKL